MKKITFYLMMLLSVTAFAQVEIIENFDGAVSWTTTEMQTFGSFACGGSGDSMTHYGDANTVGTASSPNYAGISNGTALTASFSYNIFIQDSNFFPRTYSAPPAGWGSLVFEYSIDGGTSWVPVTTIDDSNYVMVDELTCQHTGDISVGTIPNGVDFQARFTATVNDFTGFKLFVQFDDVSITQIADAVPNCDATLVSPINGSDTAESDMSLMWQAATGLPTGYKVSVGTTSGSTDVVNEAITTETSYALTGLAYETQYFVTIVPFNGIGDATGCIEESFTTRIAPVAGASCASSIEIASVPYLAIGNTDDYEDEYDASPCNNGYMRGKDVFYEYTPAVDESINIGVSNIDNSGASVHVVEGCIDVATECVAYIGTSSGTSLDLTEVVLTGGTTYFIVLSNSGSTRTYNYQLYIDKNNCINPTFTVTPDADCGSGRFYVDVDVTYLGDATSLVLTDDAGVANETITATGIVNVGPYASGSLVSFTLTNNQDTSCSYTDSTFFYCPPTNDECTDAIDLTSTINSVGSCAMVTAASNTGATESAEGSGNCSSSNTNDVWFRFTATSETMILEYLNAESAPGFATGGILQATELFSGSDCGTLTSLACFTTNYVTFSGLTPTNIYYFRNNTNIGDTQQNFDICLSEAPTPPANDECMNADTLNAPTTDNATENVSGTTVGATLSADNACNTSGFGDVWYAINPTVDGLFEFSLDENPTSQDGAVYYSLYEGACGSLTVKSTACNSNSNTIFALNSGTSYYVMVQSNQITPGLTFDLAITKLPDAVVNNDCSTPSILIESTNDTGNNAITSNLENSYPSAEACTSSYKTVWYSLTPTLTGTYHFDFTTSGARYSVYDTDDCTNTSGNYVTGITSCYNSGDKTGELVAGNTYLINVSISTTSSASSEFTLFAYPDPSLSVEANSFEAFSYYPNPVINTLTVEAKNTISNISIFNIVGQQVTNIAPNHLKSIVDMNELNDGVYFVTVTIQNSQKTFKIIKR